MLIEEMRYPVGRAPAPMQSDVLDLQAQLGIDCLQPVLVFQEAPLQEHAPQPHIGSFPSFADVTPQDMKGVQLCLRRQRDPQRMGESRIGFRWGDIVL